MTSSLRTFSKRILIFSNIIVVIFFLLSCSNMFLGPGKWWVIALLGLAFPFLLILVFAFLIFWLFRRSKWALLSVFSLVLGWPNINALIGTTIGNKTDTGKLPGTVRILSWNVRQFGWFTGNKNDTVNHQQILDFIQSQDADILCLQEFYENLSKAYKKNSAFEYMKRLGYNYFTYAQDYYHARGMYSMGIVIFSKYPITDSLRLRYRENQGLKLGESLLSADIDINGRKIRVFTTHLQSNQFEYKDYDVLHKISKVDDSVYSASRSVVKKLRSAYRNREDQADMVRIQLDNSPLPEIITGDFNDVPNSYAYFKIRGDRQDAFAKKGWGIGRTFSHISPTLRIDYIMADKQFKVLRYERKILNCSDHYPLVTDLQLPSK